MTILMVLSLLVVCLCSSCCRWWWCIGGFTGARVCCCWITPDVEPEPNNFFYTPIIDQPLRIVRILEVARAVSRRRLFAQIAAGQNDACVSLDLVHSWRWRRWRRLITAKLKNLRGEDTLHVRSPEHCFILTNDSKQCCGLFVLYFVVVLICFC